MSVFWCAGMYASGSTWAYNVMRALAAADPSRTVRSGFADTIADLSVLAEPILTHVVKTHHLPPEAAALLLAAAPRIVVTIRDPRDAVASLMTYQRYSFALALETVARSARFATAAAAHQGALLLRYETGFTDNPATVVAIADTLGVPADAATRASVFEGYRRAAVERFIGALDTLPTAQRDVRSGNVYDPETRWHKHHAGRTGEVGRWRNTLVLGQPAAVEQALGDWMEQNAYEKSGSFGASFNPGYTMTIGNLTFGER